MKQYKNQRKVTYRSSDGSGHPVPCIPIQGMFLQNYGFSVGDSIVVSYSNGFVTICKIINSRPGGDAAMALAVR